MKNIIIILFLYGGIVSAQNLIENGSFELNNIIDNACLGEISNVVYSGIMHHSTAFSVYGYSENAIFFRSCMTYDSTIVSDDIAYQGDYSIRVALIDSVISGFHYEKYTALSLSNFTNWRVL